MDMIPENFKAISKLIGEVQANLSTSVQGITTDNRRQAVEIVRPLLTEKPTVEELETWLAQQRNEAKKNKVKPKPINEVRGENKTMVELYEAWCWQNDNVASDNEIAYWTGTSRQAVSNGRARAKDKGFEFAAAGRERWKITKRPAVTTANVNQPSDKEKFLVAALEVWERMHK